MEQDRAFSFKLVVPSRLSGGQVSAVRPQEAVGHRGRVTPTKPTRQDFSRMKVVPPMEKDESQCNPGQLYAKLLDEVVKIKEWKVRVESETAQKERRLQENKRTTETQRKAIQELQFGNESLSLKLEEQISENEDLRNKNNATRSLCNILKDTFQRSSEKMLLFESEREETHQLFLQNSESVEKLIREFENLCVRVEADQQELLKVKEGFLQFEELKQKYCQEYNMKEEEVAELQTKLGKKDNELNQLLLELKETQKLCTELQEVTGQQGERLRSSEAQRESLLQKLQTAERQRQQAQQNQDAAAAALKQSEAQRAQIVRSKDFSLQELSRVQIQQAEKLEQIQTTAEELQSSLASEMQRTQELEEKLVARNEELQNQSAVLRESAEQNAEKDERIRTLHNELDMTFKSVQSMSDKVNGAEVKMEELAAELSKKTEQVQIFKSECEMAAAENRLLKTARQAAERAQEDLNKKSNATELKVQELEGHFITEKKKNTEEMEQLRKEATHHKAKYEELLSNFDELQCEKTAMQQQLQRGSENEKAAEESEEKAAELSQEIQRLREQNVSLHEEVKSITSRFQRKCHETETLQKKIEENCELLQEKVTEKEKQIKTVEFKLSNVKRKIDAALKAKEEQQKENQMLKKQIAKEMTKSSQLENVLSDLQEEALSLKKLNERDHEKLLQDLESKSTFTAELENEVQKLKVTASEAVKDREEAELKCQHKIADMVALMEKHKNQYDRMVEEKDVELKDNKRRELGAVAQTKSLELDLLKRTTENDQLKKELKTERSKTGNLQKELTELKKEMSSVSGATTQQSPASTTKQGARPQTPKESDVKRHVFNFSRTHRTLSHSRDDGTAAAAMKSTEPDGESLRSSIRTTPKKKDFHSDGPKPSGTPVTFKVGGTSKIKSYRIRTPPSDEQASRWKKTFELDSRSDSSDHNDLLTFANESASHCKLGTFKKIQSPVALKSPGNLLKLAAMKRMRDAGWTAVTSSDKKKKMKKNSEKIFG